MNIELKHGCSLQALKAMVDNQFDWAIVDPGLLESEIHQRIIALLHLLAGSYPEPGRSFFMSLKNFNIFFCFNPCKYTWISVYCGIIIYKK